MSKLSSSGARRGFTALLTVAALALVALPALAQTDVTTTRISGTVQDVDGGVLPGVTVEARNQDTGLVVTGVTDGNGFYRVLNLPTGNYTISAKLDGFATSSRRTSAWSSARRRRSTSPCRRRRSPRRSPSPPRCRSSR